MKTARITTLLIALCVLANCTLTPAALTPDSASIASTPGDATWSSSVEGSDMQ